VQPSPQRDPSIETETNPPPSLRVAVAIPCFNEAAAIAIVVEQWRTTLPDAEVVVFDNRSTDGTGPRARASGARVVEVPDRGKGNVVRAIFAELADRDAVILVDGDGTYPAEAAPALLRPIFEDRADMTVGARRPVDEAGAMSPVRGLGNVLIRAAFRVLIGHAPGDLLSGYRGFSRHFLRAVAVKSRGFEIEAELSSEAIARGMRVVEVPVCYRPRIAGTASKLNALRDGVRILATIARQGLRLRPWRLVVLAACALAVLLLGALLAGRA
jgi:glycosyltransferase involved in cell wall biosynthesis